MPFGSRRRGCNPSAASSYVEPSTKSRNCLPGSALVASSPTPAAIMLREWPTQRALLGIKAVIVMPSNAPEIKVKATRALGAEIVTVGPASSERKARAEELAAALRLRGHSSLRRSRHHCRAGKLRFGDYGRPAGGGTGAGAGGRRRLAQRRRGCREADSTEVRVIGVEPELASDAAQSFHSG